MKYSIKTSTRENWLAVAKSCPHATYFHTPYWYDAIAPKNTHLPLEVIFEDGASAVIPLVKKKRIGGIFVDHISSPNGTYGGWLSASTLSEEHAQILRDILLSRKNVTCRINPFDKSLAPLPLKENTRIIDDFTHILDMTKSEDEILRGMSKGHRSAITLAARDGIVVKIAETFEEWEQYYALYEDSLKRWRGGGAELKTRTVYPPEFFRAIFEKRSGNEILWLAFKDEVPVAGALFFYWNRHAVSWHGAASAEHFAHRPNNLLYWEIILDAKKRGYKIFDFNPSGGYSGVEAFKSHFGAVRVSSPMLISRSPARALLSRLRGVS